MAKVVCCRIKQTGHSVVVYCCFTILTRFTIPETLHATSVYEVNLRQYTTEGTISAFRAHLPRLQEMGVDVLWFMPIHPIGIKNRKGTLGSYYSVKDYLDINPEFGTRDDFRNLVQDAHRRGMRVIIDWVANHTAWDHPWTREHPEYYLRDQAGGFISPYDWTDAIQIDHRSAGEQEAMIDAMAYWVKEFDIDGFRTDLAHLTPLPFWVEARKRIEQIKPALIWLGETEDPAYFSAFDINYALEWTTFTEQFVKDSLPVSAMTGFLEKQWKLMPQDSWQLYYTSNHDENTWNGTEYDKYGVYARALAVCTFTLPGALPCIYGSQEIPNHKRVPFFEKDHFDWPEVPALQLFYARLLDYRRKRFPGGDFSFLEAPEGMLVYRRSNGESDELVLMNLGKQPVHLSSFVPGLSGVYLEVTEDRISEWQEQVSRTFMPGDCMLLVRQA